ncbi:MAG: SprT family zinc-dependent metalloprotease [Candidatus Palauibacterales bacterium]|nr:SprT family zinc-dependent metalloprotease [Candidatus Palauibacterales bacterium]
MESQITLGDITVDVVRKNVKNINLTVHPPLGRVRISAPRRVSMKTIRAFAHSKLDWIQKHQDRMRQQVPAPPREPRRRYVDEESHHVWGKPYLLSVWECDEPPSVRLNHRYLELQVRPRTNRDKRQAIVEKWYREQIRAAVPPLLARWEPRLGVRSKGFYVQQMKTRWGSCNPDARTIRLNTELATKPPERLEYIVVHELVHLLEPTHNARFVRLMDRHMPDWKFHRDALNLRPVRGEDWGD